MLAPEQRARVRALNNQLRQFQTGGRTRVTSGVVSLGVNAAAEALEAFPDFDDFTEANDPFGEHDFDTMWVAGRQLFWKIDYYDLSYGGAASIRPMKRPVLAC
jgi:hypothetical protein